jgi:N-acetylglucosamine kinase-like BadF-type ATPase
LLGDEGSAVWLGLEGIRAALRAHDGRGPHSLLAETVPSALGIASSSDVPMGFAVVREAHVRPPAALGRLAPVVVDAAVAGDPVAEALLDAAVECLVRLVASVVDADSGPDIVLTGSFLTEATPIGRAVRGRIAKDWPTAVLADASSGEPGAVALAIERHTGKLLDSTTLGRLRDAAAMAAERLPVTRSHEHPPGDAHPPSHL